jgi:hypothetical protein
LNLHGVFNNFIQNLSRVNVITTFTCNSYCSMYNYYRVMNIAKIWINFSFQQKLDETKFEVGKISEKVEEISAEHMIPVERVKSLEINEGKTTEQIRSHAIVIAPCITTIASWTLLKFESISVFIFKEYSANRLVCFLISWTTSCPMADLLMQVWQYVYSKKKIIIDLHVRYIV